MAPQLLIAARGWDHDAWTGHFYPQDLPREWRLAYYANEFRAIVVPFGGWSEATVEEVAQWIEDSGPGFRFFLELPHTGHAAATAQVERAGTEPVGTMSSTAIAGLLGERLGGFLLTSPVDISRTPALAGAPHPASPPEPAERDEALTQPDSGAVRERPKPLPTPGTPQRSPTAAYWDERSGIRAHGPLAAGRVQASLSLRQLRSRMDEFLAYAADCACALLVVEGEAPDRIPDPVMLRQAQQLGELSGH